MPINQKRGYRLLKENCLLVRKETKLKAKWTVNTKKPRANQWWGIDMTKVLTAQGWCYIVLVIDWQREKGSWTLCWRAIKSVALADCLGQSGKRSVSGRRARDGN